MQPHEQRVVDEEKDLMDKLSKLHTFINVNTIFESLPEEDKELLKRQYHVMLDYCSILRTRIALFNNVKRS